MREIWTVDPRGAFKDEGLKDEGFEWPPYSSPDEYRKLLLQVYKEWAIEN